MPADEALDPPPVSVLAALTARYPRWTFWFGRTTRHWWALPPRDRDIADFVEATSVKELIDSIEKVQRNRRNAHRSPSGPFLGDLEAQSYRRLPAAAWPGIPDPIPRSGHAAAASP